MILFQGLTADMNMYNSMFSEEKVLNERLIREIDDYKSQYFRMRKMMDRNPAESALQNISEEYKFSGILPPVKALYYGGGFKTKEEHHKDGMTVAIYPSQKTRERPKSEELRRSKDTNIAMINITFPDINRVPIVKEVAW